MNTFRIIRTDRNADPSVLLEESLLIGRALTSDLQLPHPAVAAVHAGVTSHDGAFWLSALADATTSPVWLNDTAVQQAPLSDDDTVRIGPYVLRMAVGPETLQITVDFALELALAELEAAEPPVFIGTPADERVLERYWERRLQTVEVALTPNRNPPGAPQTGQAIRPARRNPLRWLAFVVVLLMLCVAVGAWVYPQVYSPGPLSAAHAARTLPVANLIAKRATGACGACHTLTGTMPQQCSACHTTTTFQAAIAQKHLNLGLTCRACHTEHRGVEFNPALVANAVCTNCHQTNPPNGNPNDNQNGNQNGNQGGDRTLHGHAVSYPVRNGLWLWAGLSQTSWRARGLPGQTVDYNLREQFHMLHAQGRVQGRTQCVDCHLGGTAGAALKRNVRESCAQCHSLQPAFAAALSRMAETQPLQTGNARCVSCHAQHGVEKDLRASVRK